MKKLLLAMLLGASTFTVAACDNDDPVEDAAEDAADAVDDAADDMEDELD